MAKFNPDVPQVQVPNFQGATRPISPVDSDKSMHTLFAGIGNLFEEGVKGVDLIQKSDIYRQLTTGVDKERDQYTEAQRGRVELLKAAGAKPVVDGTTDATGDDLEISDQRKILPGQPDETRPQPVEQLPQKVGNLQAAADAGKISPTYYHQQLTNLAKSLRAQYPGQREYIDKTISQLTGGNPANALYRDLAREGDQLAKGLQDPSAKQLLRQAYELNKEGYEDAGKAGMDFERGLITKEELVIRLAKPKRAQAIHAANKALRDEETGDAKLDADQARRAWNQDSGAVVQSGIDALVSTLAGGNSPEDTAKRSNFILTGRNPDGTEMSGDQKNLVVQRLVELKVATERKLNRMANEPGYKGRTLKGLIGDDVDKDIKAQVALIDRMIDNFTNKNFGAMHNDSRYIEMNNDAVGRRLMDPRLNPGVATYTQIMGGLKAAFGGNNELATEFAKRFLLTDPKNPGSKNPLLTSGNWDLNLFVIQPGMQPNTGGQPGNLGGSPPGPTTYMDAVKRYEQEKQTGNPNFAKIIQSQVKLTQSIGEKNPQTEDARYNVALAAFSPGNLGYIGKLKSEESGVLTLNRIPQGAFTMYRNMTSLPILEQTKELSLKKDGGILWNNAANWIEHSFSRELVPREIQNLNVQSSRYQITYIPSTDNSAPKWTIVPRMNPNDPNLSPAERAALRTGAGVTNEYRQLLGSVNRLNVGMEGMYNLYKTSKDEMSQVPGQETVDRYILNMLHSQGVDLSKQSGSVVEEMAAAIIKDSIKRKGQKKTDTPIPLDEIEVK